MTTSLPLALDAEHARFNAAKTFSTTSTSRFETRPFGALLATRDSTRPDSYYQRVLGLSPDSLAHLDEALAWVKDQAPSETSVRVEVDQDRECSPPLIERGFRQAETILWLYTTELMAGTSDSAQGLTQQDWPALRSLLEHHGPIADDTWQLKRGFLCTESFRWFGIHEDDLLVSAASMWIHGDTAILGSALTLPGYRNRGHHAALLRARRAQPPSLQFVDVEPGSTSHANCVRAGFEPLEHRTVWIG